MANSIFSPTSGGTQTASAKPSIFSASPKPAPAPTKATPSPYLGPYAPNYSPAVTQAVDKVAPAITTKISGNPNIPGLGTIFTPTEAKQYGATPSVKTPISLVDDVKNIWNNVSTQFKEATKPTVKTPDVIKPITPPSPSPTDPNDLQLTIQLGNINAHNAQLSSTQKDLEKESEIIKNLGSQIDTMKEKVDPTNQSSINKFNSLVNTYNSKLKDFTPKITDFQNSVNDLKTKTDTYNTALEKNNSQKQYAAQLFGDAGKDPHGLWGAVWKDLSIPVKVLPAMISGIWKSETAPDENVQNIESNMIGGSKLFGDAGKDGLGTAVAQDLQIPAKIMTRFFAPIIQGAGQNIADAILANSAGARATYGITEKDIPDLPSAKETILQGVGNFMQLAFAIATPGIAEKLGLAGASEATMEDILQAVANKSASQSFAPLAKIIGQKAVEGAINGGEAGLLFGTGQALSSGSKDPMEITSTIFSSAVGMAMLGAALGGGSTLTESAKTALFKNVSDFYGIPKDFSLKVDALNHLLDTKQMSEEDGKSILKSFGFSEEQITKMRSGEAHYTITRPTQDIFEITDKPYWAKLKSIIGLDSATEQIPHNIKGTEITGEPTGIVPFTGEATEETPIIPQRDIAKAAEEIKTPEENSFKGDIEGLALNFRQKSPSIEGINPEQETKLSPEESAPLSSQASDQYYDRALKPLMEDNKAIVIGSDNLKDFYGKDYNLNNHSVYSGAANQLYERAVSESKNPVVKFTVGGTGSGKSDFLVPDLASGFNGVVYDSTGFNYEGIKKQIDFAKAQGKTPEIYAIVPDLARSRAYTFSRELGGDHPVTEAAFLRTHSQAIDTLKKLIADGVEVNIIDTRNLTTREQIENAEYATNPLDLLNSLQYDEDNVKREIQGISKENAEAFIKGGKESIGRLSQENGSSQGIEGRKNLAEGPVNIERVKAYKERLKLNGADPVLVDAIITPSGNTAYGVTAGGTMAFEKIVEKFTEDHEVFHQVFQNMDKMRLFKDFDKAALFDEARTLYGDIPDKQLEEEMARDFQQYVNDREQGKESSFFGKILEFFQRLFAALKRLFKNEKDIKEFYRVMSEGKAKEETVISQDERVKQFLERAKTTGEFDFRQEQYALGKFLEKTPSDEVFDDKGDLTLKTLTKLKGRATVSKQFIEDLSNSGDIKQVERELIRAILETEPDQVNVPKFAERVKNELLPLELAIGDIAKGETMSRYENITLPENLRGNVADYTEKIYTSPIKTSAGDVHFGESPMGDEGGLENYFGHTRIEDMAHSISAEILRAGLKKGYYASAGRQGRIALRKELAESDARDTGNTRRVIEVQSDLYQKGRLEDSFILPKKSEVEDRIKEIEDNKKQGKPISKNDYASLLNYRENFKLYPNSDPGRLSQYNDPTAHFRMVREEVKQAAIDGKTKLQFPTGETAMKIEGLGQGETNRFIIEDPKDENIRRKLEISDLKVGQEIKEEGELSGGWIITELNFENGDGNFSAIPKTFLWNKEEADNTLGAKNKIQTSNGEMYYKDGNVEQFDISGKVDTNNPIYRFYEKDLGRYLKNNYGAQSITDNKGVSWMEVNVDPGYADLPVPAFNEKPKKDEKNPVFDSGDKLKDVQDALAYVEHRIGVKTAEISRVKNMLTREQMSLDASKENPEVFEKVYGENRIQEHKTKISELRQRLMDLNKSITDIKSDYKPEDLEKAIEPLKPENLAPRIRVLNEEVKIPAELTNRQIALEAKREALENSPYNDLLKYVAKSGAFKGELPEVTGGKPTKENIFYGKIRDKNVLEFIRKGDQIIDSAFFHYRDIPDTETVREGMQTFIKEKENIKEERKSLLADLKSFIKTEKDKIAVEKLAQGKNEQIDKEQEKAQKIADNKRQAETLADWKNFIASYTAEQSLPQSLAEVAPPVVRGNIRSPQLNLQDAKDKGWMARESLDRNIEKVFTREDAKRLNEFLGDHLRENMAKEVEYKDAKLKILEGKMKDLGIKPGSDESAFVQIYGEGMTTVDQLMKEFPKTWQNIQKAVPIFKEMYETILKEWNPLRNKFGYPDIPPIKDYFPHFDSISFWTKHYGILNKNDDLPTSIAGLTKNFQPGKTFTRHELHRTGRKTKYDAIAGAKEYINSVAKQMFTMDSIARANAILKYIRSSDEVAQRLGTPLKLSRFTTNLQNIKQNQLASKVGGLDREIEDNGDRKVINTVLTLSKLIGKNIIAFNPAAVLSHGVSISLNAARVNKIPFIKGMMTTVSSPFLKDPYYMIDGQRSDLLFYRYPKEYLKTKFETVDEAGGWMIKQMDIFKVRTAVASKFYELTKEGVNPEVAIKEADKFAGRIVGDYSLGQKPNLMNQKVFKMIAQFQFGMNDAMSVISHDFAYDNKKLDENGNVRKNEKTGKEKQDHLKMWWQIAQWAVYAYLMNEYIYKPIKGSGKGLSPINLLLTLAGYDDSTKDVPLAGRIGQIGKDLAGELPFLNVFAGNSPTATAISQLVKDAVAGNLLGVGGDLASTFLSPIGGGNQVKKTIAGIEAYKQGFVSSKSGIPQFGVERSAWSLFQNIVFGPSATSAAQAYYNSIGKPSASKATFDEVQRLLAEGKTDEAKAITSAMTPKEYGTYKAEKTRMLETKAIPNTQKILELLKAGKIEEATKITSAMTPEEYKIYKGSKAMILKAESGLANNNNNGIATFEGHATYYGGSKGPDADTILNGNPDDGKIAGYNPKGEPIYARDARLESSRRAELVKQDPYWSVTAPQYDHIVPLEAGGTNTANNVMLISKKADEGNNPFENFIGGLYKTGGISRANAAKASIDYKIKKTVSLDDIINGKY